MQLKYDKYLIIEFIDGKTLKKFILENRFLISDFDKLKIINQIIAGIEFIHLNNIVLRDLHWENIMVDSNKNAVLTDFDRSIEINDSYFTGDIGLSYFMSPEQFYHNTYSFKADIYSLGMIIYFILTETEYNFNPSEIFSIIDQTRINILDLNILENCPKNIIYINLSVNYASSIILKKDQI